MYNDNRILNKFNANMDVLPKYSDSSTTRAATVERPNLLQTAALYPIVWNVVRELQIKDGMP